MAWNKTESCDCDTSTTDPTGTIEALASQVRELRTQLAEHLIDDPAEPEARQRATALAEMLFRIIGGKDVAPGDFPECCLIGNSSAGGFLKEWFCTGTLIHKRVVVTADHCILRAHGRVNPNSIAIGVEDQRDVQPHHIVRIRKIIRHPSEDVALLILQSDAPVDPIDLATETEAIIAGNVELVGFGNTNPAGTIGFGTKRQVNVPMMVIRKAPDEDHSQAEHTLGFDSFTEFVAGRKGSGRDSCNGDSGGPAYIEVKGKRKLLGATSRATDEANDSCGDGGIYVRLDVDPVAKWIEDNINFATTGSLAGA